MIERIGIRCVLIILGGEFSNMSGDDKGKKGGFVSILKPSSGIIPLKKRVERIKITKRTNGIAQNKGRTEAEMRPVMIIPIRDTSTLLRIRDMTMNQEMIMIIIIHIVMDMAYKRVVLDNLGIMTVEHDLTNTMIRATQLLQSLQSMRNHIHLLEKTKIILHLNPIHRIQLHDLVENNIHQIL